MDELAYFGEELDDDDEVVCKCKKCGFEEPVPGFVLDEFAGFEKFIGKKKAIPKVVCIKCHGVMVP